MPSENSGSEKGVFWKRGLFRKVHFLEIPKNLETLEFPENPQTLENKGDSDHFLEILENLENLESDSRDCSSEKTPFVMTPFSAPEESRGPRRAPESPAEPSKGTPAEASENPSERQMSSKSLAEGRAPRMASGTLDQETLREKTRGQQLKLTVGLVHHRMTSLQCIIAAMRKRQNLSILPFFP